MKVKTFDEAVRDAGMTVQASMVPVEQVHALLERIRSLEAQVAALRAKLEGSRELCTHYACWTRHGKVSHVDTCEVGRLLAKTAPTAAAYERRVREQAWRDAAEVADNEPELEGDPPAEIVRAFRDRDVAVEHLRASVRATKKAIAGRIRALATEQDSK